MAGGILQLIAYGPQDMYLTNDPQITFFKVVYRRYTNFSIQTFEHVFDDKPTFGKKASIKITRLGDLVTKMYVRIVLNSVPGVSGVNFAWTRFLGHFILKEIDMIIGGQSIDKHYSTWNHIWYQLARTGKKDRGLAHQLGDIDELITFNDQTKPSHTLYIPLQFWFNRHYGLALPFIAIQYPEIYLNLILEDRTKLAIYGSNFTNWDSLRIHEVGLVTDFIYLDTDERKKFAGLKHEYLIEQVQYHGDVGIAEYSTNRRIGFKHPVKELIWAMNNGNYINSITFPFYTHHDDWTDAINTFSYTLIRQSTIALPMDDPGPGSGMWGNVPPKSSAIYGKWQITNDSPDHRLWVNTSSLTVGTRNITGQITATIMVNTLNVIYITSLTTGITVRDLSYPLDQMIDTRLNVTTNVQINLPSNFGMYIDGSGNPFDAAVLEYNGQERFEKRNGVFFGRLQPYLHHSNTPTDGINLYSFAFEPEQLQPSGTSNMSMIDTIYLKLWLDSSINEGTFPPIELTSTLNRLYIYAFSYNILRCASGLVGISYNE